MVAVDLARPMLRVLGERASAAGLAIARLEANLCRLGCLSTGTFDYAVSMFSTLGMIRGRVARKMALAEACRIHDRPALRPGGVASTPSGVVLGQLRDFRSRHH